MHDNETRGKFTLRLESEDATRALGAQLARGLRPGLAVYLSGELGSGKTALVRAMLEALGISGKIKSPTYTIVEPYQSGELAVYHFDFYRFRNAAEWEEAGLREYFNARSVCLVEWPEKAGPDLPRPDWAIRLTVVAPEIRDLELDAATELGKQCLKLATCVSA